MVKGVNNRIKKVTFIAHAAYSVLTAAIKKNT